MRKTKSLLLKFQLKSKFGFRGTDFKEIIFSQNSKKLTGIPYVQSGHVNQLEMSPISDQFLSCGVDKTLRLWDLRKPTCAGLMEVDGVAVGTFDPGKGAFLSINFKVLRFLTVIENEVWSEINRELNLLIKRRGLDQPVIKS